MQESGALTGTEKIALPSAGRDDDSPAPSQPFAPPQPGAALTPPPEIAPAADEPGPTGDLLLVFSLVLLVAIVLLLIRIFRDRENIREARENRDAAKEEARHLRSLLAQME
mgnify:CR=1 FL=1